MRKGDILLSFVCVSRNDNHGGNSLERLVYSCKNFIKQSEKFKFPTEYIVVEWNPPKNKICLAEALRARIPKSNMSKVRVITVPRKIHKKLNYSDRLPLFQMIGKNVGIRRAHGNFVLSSNIDIVLGNRLFETITQTKLKKRIIYRSHRLDLDNKITKTEFEEGLALKYATRLNIKNATIQLGAGAAILNSRYGFSKSIASQNLLFSTY